MSQKWAIQSRMPLRGTSKDENRGRSPVEPGNVTGAASPSFRDSAVSVVLGSAPCAAPGLLRFGEHLGTPKTSRRTVESAVALDAVNTGAHARRVHALDLTVAIVLGLLLLVATLGGLVWLDRGPVGQRARELQKPPPR